jgi:hypothetical protein
MAVAPCGALSSLVFLHVEFAYVFSQLVSVFGSLPAAYLLVVLVMY